MSRAPELHRKKLAQLQHREGFGREAERLMGVQGIYTRDGWPPFSVKPVPLVVQVTVKLMV